MCVALYSRFVVPLKWSTYPSHRNVFRLQKCYTTHMCFSIKKHMNFLSLAHSVLLTPHNARTRPPIPPAPSLCLPPFCWPWVQDWRMHGRRTWTDWWMEWRIAMDDRCMTMVQLSLSRGRPDCQLRREPEWAAAVADPASGRPLLLLLLCGLWFVIP